MKQSINIKLAPKNFGLHLTDCFHFYKPKPVCFKTCQEPVYKYKYIVAQFKVCKLNLLYDKKRMNFHFSV